MCGNAQSLPQAGAPKEFESPRTGHLWLPPYENRSATNTASSWYDSSSASKSSSSHSSSDEAIQCSIGLSWDFKGLADPSDFLMPCPACTSNSQDKSSKLFGCLLGGVGGCCCGFCGLASWMLNSKPENAADVSTKPSKASTPSGQKRRLRPVEMILLCDRVTT